MSNITVSITEAVEEITTTIVEDGETIVVKINELPRGVAGPNSVTSATTSNGTAELTIASLSSSGSILCTGIEGSIEATGANAVIGVTGAGSAIIASGAGSYIETSGTYRLINSGAVATLSATLTTNRAISFPDRTGTLAMGSGTNGAIVSADVTDKSANGDATDEGKVIAYGAGGGITTLGDNASIVTEGSNAGFYTNGNNATIATSGANAHVSTVGGGYVSTSSTFKISNVGVSATTLSGTQTADRSIAFPDASGTVALTTSNVSTATALQTARTIFGQSFNGTANIGGGTITLANNLTTSGNFALTLTTTGTTNVTLPTTGTLTTLAGTETLTNKTLTTPTIASIAGTATSLGTGSANFVTVTGSATNPTLSTAGSSTNIDLILQAKGNGITQFITANTNGDVGSLRNTSATGYSTLAFFDNSNVNKGAIGYCNPSATTGAGSLIFFTPTGVPHQWWAGAARRMTLSAAGGLSIGTTTDAGATNLLVAGSIVSGGVVRLKGYTFATLPAGTQGDKAFITDGAALPIFRANAAGGGSTVTEVFFNGTAWINS
jgi:hypothetical protein